jgi:hypothetical protein
LLQNIANFRHHGGIRICSNIDDRGFHF